MYRIKPMPLTGGFIRLNRLRGGINTLGGGGLETRTQGGLDFPRFDIPSAPESLTRQPQRKPVPINLRLQMDLRDVRLYVDVIVDMLLQSLDGRAYSGGLPQSGGVSRQLASNPEVRRILDKLLERADMLKSGENPTAEEIIRRLMNETIPSKDAADALPKLPLCLKSIAVTREKSASQSRLGRRERLIREARKLVLAQIRFPGQTPGVITKQKDDSSALQVIVPHTEAVYRDIGTNGEAIPAPDGKSGARQKNAQEDSAKKNPATQKEREAETAPRNFKAARVEYLRDYRHAPAQTPVELAEKLVDAKTLSRLSGEAAASLNRMLEQGKLTSAKGVKPDAARPNTAETVMTCASLYPDKGKSGKRGGGYNIIIKNLFYTDKMPDTEHIRLSALPPEGLRYSAFGRGIGGFSGSRVVTEKKISQESPFIQKHAGVREQSGAGNSAMFFAETPVAAAAARIEAQQAAAAQQTHPVYDAPDTAKLKRELAAQAGKELDDIIRRKLNVDKLTDKIYRNLENRLRSERIRRGIV